jgi:CheY-like chemotaxis protein
MRSILLIDDDLEFLRQMATTFRGAGYTVRAAADGQAGLARFIAEPVDVVVTDIIMPNREGIETIVALKKADPAVKVVAISGGYRIGPQAFLDLARHVGADGALGKPFRLGELLDLVAKLLPSPPSRGAV